MLPNGDPRIYQLDGYQIRAGGKVGQCAERGEPYEAKLLADIAALDATGIAVDVGAHIGNHSLWLAAHGFEVLAFEPDPDSFQQLESNIALNPDLIVHAYPVALGNRATHGKFVAPGTIQVDRGDTEVVTFDAYMADLLGPDRVSVVKVDVEGMEHLVLIGMLRMLKAHRPVVYAEAHSRIAERQQLMVLGGLGYEKVRDIQMGSRMVKWAR